MNHQDKLANHLPSWDVYCPNTTGKNALVFDVSSRLRVWFSYKTPVAFVLGKGPVAVRVNDWGPITGKHINAIDGGDKASRIRGDVFERLLAEALGS